MNTAIPDVAISVVMPVHNGAEYIEGAVESILRQTYPHFELIIVDDGSTDGSRQIAERYADSDSRVRVIGYEENRGNYPARNAGMAAARGTYIAAMDADDIASPDRLERQKDFMDNHPEYVLIGSQVLLIDPDGNPIGPMPGLHQMHQDIDTALLDRKWGVLQSSVLMRREDVMAIGGYRERFRTCGDHDLWLRLAEVGQVGNLPDTLLHYRLHYDSLTHNQSDQPHNLRVIEHEARQRRGLTPLTQSDIPPIREERPLSLKEKRLLHIRWARRALRNGYRRTAVKNLRKSFLLSPLDTFADVARLTRRRLGGAVSRLL